MIFTFALLAALPLFVEAQGYGYGGGSGSTPTSAAAATVPSAPMDTPGHKNIDVGYQQTFSFHPNSIQADVGTLVTFWFPNTAGSGIQHSVSQSSFSNPCTTLAANGSDPAGFDSGLTQSAQFTINITDTSREATSSFFDIKLTSSLSNLVPFRGFFACNKRLLLTYRPRTHCGVNGMVGVINPPTNGTNTFDNFMAAAKALGSNEVTETDKGFQAGGLHAQAVAAPSNTAAPGSGSGASPQRAVSIGAILLSAAAIAFAV
ncbi:hypothetical protein C8J56DRAFT_1101641 [Mycena floridula]|nr:hypothetical protein C8J56DRAFT_1101641 [Mycena floridula]